jgi:phage tail-like protein
MAIGARNDPFNGYNFRLDIGKITVAQFRSCGGLDSTRAPIKYREGTDKTLVSRQLAGMVSHSNITLSHGITTDHSLWDWYNGSASNGALVAGQAGAEYGAINRVDISIWLRDDAGQDRVQWKIKQAWPTKWTGPSFDATSDAIAIESLELAHEGIEVVQWQ